MKLAHIVPTSMLELTKHCDAFLCLSSLIISDPVYADFHMKRAASGKMVILDNPVHENGTLNVDNWVMACAMVQPKVTIIPDVIDDADATVDNAIKYRHLIREVAPNTRLMAVPHGETNVAYLKCAQAFMKLRDPAIHWFGVSLERRLENDPLAFQRRITRVRLLESEPSFAFRNIHLLGVSETAIDLIHPPLRGVVSADTSKFTVFWLNGIAVHPPSPINIAYPGRKSLGGSTEYFNYRVPSDMATYTGRFFSDYLEQWNHYARNGR